jgi:hypothetical protein
VCGERRGRGGASVQRTYAAPPPLPAHAATQLPTPPPPASEDIFKEIDILCCLDHENVVALKEYFEEDNMVGLRGAGGGGV